MRVRTKLVWAIAVPVFAAGLAGRLTAEETAAKKSGIYIQAGAASPARLTATMTTDQKQSGIAATMLSGGFIKPKVLFKFGGEHGSFETAERQPTFEFVFSKEGRVMTPSMDFEKMADQQNTLAMGDSPKDYRLARLEEKDGDRILTSEKSANISFEFTKLGPKDFTVTLKQPLEPGEYGFVESSSGGGGRLWGFTIKAQGQ